jgi:uncharacterized protein
VHPEKRDIQAEKLKKLINFFAANKKILTVYLYGSYGTKFEKKNSDIDFGILFSSPLSLLEELALAAEIEKIMSRETDLASLNKINVLLKYNIIETGMKIYEKDFILTANFVESVLKEYFDYGIKLKKFKRDFHESLVKEYTE